MYYILCLPALGADFILLRKEAQASVVRFVFSVLFYFCVVSACKRFPD